MAKILVIDDDIHCSELIDEVAQLHDHDVVISNDPLKVESLIHHNPDVELIFLDLQMPERDGIEVMRGLAEINYRGGVIIVSGMDTEVVMSAYHLAQQHQFTTHTPLHKPFTINQLQTLINHALAEQQPNSLGALSAKKPSQLMSLEAVKEALDNGKIELHYQPIISLQYCTVSGFECLVRIVTDEGKLIYPDAFISVIEENALNKKLLEQVLTRVKLDYETHLHDYSKIRLAVNITGTDLDSTYLPDEICSRLKGSLIKPTNISLEIAQTRAIQQDLVGLDILTRLRLKGFHLAIDDFGTGNSSMTTIKQMPFSALKIDNSLINQITDDKRTEILCRDLITMAHDLQLEVTAEGVEDIETITKLRHIGCDLVQGYFFSKPLPPCELVTYLESVNNTANVSINEADMDEVQIKPLSQEDQQLNAQISSLLQTYQAPEDTQPSLIKMHNLGLALPLTGRLSAIGKSYYLGAELAYQWFKTQTPEIEKRLSFNVFDSESSTQNLVQLYKNRELAHIDSWMGAICPLSDSDYLIRQSRTIKKPILAPFNGDLALRKPEHQHIFNFKNSYYEELLAILHFADLTGGYKCVIMTHSPLGLLIQRLLKQSRPEVDVLFSNGQDETHNQKILQHLIKVQAHHVIFVSSQRVLLHFMNQYRNKNPDARFYSVSLISISSIHALLSEQDNHIYFSSPVPSLNHHLTIVEQFLSACKQLKLANSKRLLNSISLEAFSTVSMTLRLLTKCQWNMDIERLNQRLAESPIVDIGLIEPLHWNSQTRSFGPTTRLVEFDCGNWKATTN